jgi:hypothetical protein
VQQAAFPVARPQLIEADPKMGMKKILLVKSAFSAARNAGKKVHLHTARLDSNPNGKGCTLTSCTLSMSLF